MAQRKRVKITNGQESENYTEFVLVITDPEEVDSVEFFLIPKNTITEDEIKQIETVNFQTYSPPEKDCDDGFVLLPAVQTLYDKYQDGVWPPTNEKYHEWRKTRMPIAPVLESQEKIVKVVISCQFA